MANLSERQALAIAKQLHTRFGDRITTACAGSIVDPAFLAGIIANEAGRDRRGWISETATRFEPAVFADLKSLRDNGYCFVAGRKRVTYSGIAQKDILGATDDALRALATSYGLTQIMGYHGLSSLGCSVADLRDPAKHLGYAVRLLEIVAKPYLTKARATRSATVRDAELEKVCRIWNTGRPNGKTYHDSYVPTARAVRLAYAGLKASPDLRPDDRQQPATPVAESAGATTGPASPASNETPASAPVEIQAPEPAGFLAKLKGFVASLVGGTTLLAFAEKFGSVTISTSILVVVCLIVALAFLGFVVWYVVDSWKQAQRVKVTADINSDPARKDIVFKQ